MQNVPFSTHYDLVSPDGKIVCLSPLKENIVQAEVEISHISKAFVGFFLDPQFLSFNLKSTLAQLGMNATTDAIELDSKKGTARLKVVLKAFGPIATALLALLTEGSYIGKLFAADPQRRVRNPDYLLRMFGRTDRQGRPLLSLGGPKGRDDLLLEKKDSRTVAYLELQAGALSYDLNVILGLIPTVAKALLHPLFRLRTLIQLNQIWEPLAKRVVLEDKILLVRTAPLHIRTAFGKVVDELLPQGIYHTSANVLEPDTKASGDVYELFGKSSDEITKVPIEFYTLEPYKEHVFFSDRDQLKSCLEQPKTLFQAFDTAPKPFVKRAAVFVVKGEQLLALKEEDWSSTQTHMNPFPGLFYPSQQALLVQRYIEQQACYPFLKGIEDGHITSQGILLTRYFPSPLMKRMLLSDRVQRSLKAIYFQYPSLSYGNFFSHEDRSFMLDLAKFGIALYWVDKNFSSSSEGTILQYVPKPGKDAGMFVPEHLIEPFINATSFGIYGSTIVTGHFEEELTQLLSGIVAMKAEMNHPLLNPQTPIALITGGGPGLMEVGNKVAKQVGVLSCANIVDFRNSSNLNIQEQKQNPYIEAKMTYRLDRLVERQAEFHLDFPIILTGGFGTDFEQCLEEVRRKVGSIQPTPVLLFGTTDYWKEKITARYQCNLKTGTIRHSEWVSNSFYCVNSAEQGLKVYRQYFSNALPIGPESPPASEGFISVT